MQIRLCYSVEVKYIRIQVPVSSGDTNMPLDYPFRTAHGLWDITVDLATRYIRNWPPGWSPRDITMWVGYRGVYTLLDDKLRPVFTWADDLVPRGVVPELCNRTYIDLHISLNGRITNWPREEDLDFDVLLSEEAD